MRLGALLGPVTANAPAIFLAEQARRYVGEGVSEAVLKVEASRMVTFPEASPSAPGCGEVFYGHWHELYASRL